MRKIEQVVAENIKELRKKMGLTQEGLARSAKVSLITVNRIERCLQKPNAANLEAIAIGGKASGTNIDLGTGYLRGLKHHC